MDAHRRSKTHTLNNSQNLQPRVLLYLLAEAVYHYTLENTPITNRQRMFVRAYLRASTADQDATRARRSLELFAAEKGHKIANFYIENASGNTSERDELQRMLADSQPGDVLLVESVDRLSRLPEKQWEMLRDEIRMRELRVVALDLPTSYQALQPAAPDKGQDVTAWMLRAINEMMLDMAAAIARKDYELRRQRQRQGIDKAKAAGIYQGRPRDEKKRQKIAELLAAGWSSRKIAGTVICSTSTVQSVREERKAAGL